ncbi:hypothetical protein AMS68_001648 [Peltaster fructicola]|uniref:DUF676 domain-containing protein n=1 Tax=Peltaster fructicola TaxID=286661 RepID=A0A6H0XNA2_9PEZI|nr:hypothetical protein AMS68_001648 [Peltaster fructicola]
MVATKHLCVLIHGLWGNPPHLNHLKHTLEDSDSTGNLHVLVPKGNADYFTYDGIEVGAERIAHEIEETIAELSRQGAKLDKISVIGYSLGGVIARYVIGLLYKDGVFERLKPINFTTFASLWIGIRSPAGGIGGAAWNAIAPRTLSVTGRQMFVADKFRDTGRPLLAILADPNSIFLRALKAFKHKSLYANTQNDRSVPYYTASFSRSNPFVDLDAVDVHYLPGQDEKVLLDPACPVTPSTHKAQESGFERFKIRSRRFGNKLPMYAIFTLLFPIAATYMIVNGAYQTYRSSSRIRQHESGKTLVDSRRFRFPLLEEVQAMQDHNMERLANAQSGEVVDHAEKGDDGFKALALAPVQLEMIRNLEAVGITRYAAHIQNARHTHAAIIVRYQTPDFSEGVAVVNHWVQHFEI